MAAAGFDDATPTEHIHPHAPLRNQWHPATVCGESGLPSREPRASSSSLSLARSIGSTESARSRPRAGET